MDREDMVHALVKSRLHQLSIQDVFDLVEELFYSQYEDCSYDEILEDYKGWFNVKES